MPTRLLVLVAMALLAPASAAAAPQLIGRRAESGPLRLLHRDLGVVKGSPRIPGRSFSTLVAPGGARFAAFTDDELLVYDRRTGRRLRRYRVKGGGPQLWLSRRRILLQRSAARFDVLDVRTGSAKRLLLTGEAEHVGVVAGRPTIVVRRADGDATLVQLGRSGAVTRRLAVRLQEALRSAPSVLFTSAGDGVVASDGTHDALVRVDGDTATVAPLALAPGFWSGLSDSLLAQNAGEGLARIDPRTGSVLKVATTPPALPAAGAFRPPETVGAYAGGAIVGGGRVRFDAELRIAASNPAAVPEKGAWAVRRAGRLYVRVFDCEDGSSAPPTVRIVDADSLRTIRTRRFDAVGVLGGSVIQEAACD